MAALFPRLLRRAACALPAAALALSLSGCVTPPPSHRTAARTLAEAPRIKTVAVLPLDVEVAELSTGGMTEKRDDWTAQVTTNLEDAVERLTSFRPARGAADRYPEALAAELDDIRTLYRAITANQFIHGFYGPPILDSVRGPLRYELGAMDALLDAAGADAALVVFVRDEYSTGGRKAVAILGALAGIPVRTGVTVSSAALVHRDGTLLWMNHTGAMSGDLRTPAGADATVKNLFQGVPALATTP